MIEIKDIELNELSIMSDGSVELGYSCNQVLIPFPTSVCLRHPNEILNYKTKNWKNRHYKKFNKKMEKIGKPNGEESDNDFINRVIKSMES